MLLMMQSETYVRYILYIIKFLKYTALVSHESKIIRIEKAFQGKIQSNHPRLVSRHLLWLHCILPFLFCFSYQIDEIRFR